MCNCHGFQEGQQESASLPVVCTFQSISLDSSRRLEELEDEVRQLRSSVSCQLLGTPPQQIAGKGSSVKERSGNASGMLSGLGYSLDEPIAIAHSPRSLGQVRYSCGDSDVPTSPRSLGNVRLNIGQIDDLFNL